MLVQQNLRTSVIVSDLVLFLVEAEKKGERGKREVLRLFLRCHGAGFGMCYPAHVVLEQVLKQEKQPTYSTSFL